ncbi:hypothetical protein EYF80_028438 [Liparis tanakae]|uniref:Uncharacterized protein n=1 Tax=Liparis tanakae TaxID=230148 RepID=A0A4Z2H6T2_9TELE|nr:hypothetical protein EYF80_028438 [Liparis tanakae]
MDALALDLKFLSIGSTNFLSGTDLVDSYNQSLSSLLDLHAPIKSRSAPWYTCELHKMKTAGRVIERRLKASGLTVHKQAYREHRKAYAEALRDAQSKFYSTIINNSPGNSKQLFSTVNHLLKPLSLVHPEATEDRCNMNITFFRQKVENIRSHLSAAAVLSLTTTDPLSEFIQPLCSFSIVTQEEVEDMIKNTRQTTCALDPFPSALLKTNTSAISPLITKIINHSLLAGHIPSALKTAVIRPLLLLPSRVKTSLSPHPSPTLVLKWTPISLLTSTSNTSARQLSITSGTSPNSVQHSP